MTTCRHCSRRIEKVEGLWIDPEATGDDSVWRETCDRHDTFEAQHEPDPNTEACPDHGLSNIKTNEHRDAWCGSCDERLIIPGHAGYPEEVQA